MSALLNQSMRDTKDEEDIQKGWGGDVQTNLSSLKELMAA